MLFIAEVWNKFRVVLNLGFPSGLDSKESISSWGDLGSIPGLGRSPGGGHSNPVFLPIEVSLSYLVWR